MSLQEDINKSFGTSNYFDNKDQMRNEINDFIRNQRGINSARNAISRNLRRGLRARIGTAESNATGDLVKTAKSLGIDNPLAGGGLGMEAGRARKFAEFTLNKNFEEEQKKKQELEARTRGIPVAGQQNAGVQPAVGANSVLAPEATATAIVEQGQQKSFLTKPDWAKDVEGDKTFPKGFFDDKLNLVKIQGKSRAEVADMLNKARVARFMSDATKRGDTLRNEEYAKEAAALGKRMFDQQIEFNSQVEGIVKSKIDNARNRIYAEPFQTSSGLVVENLGKADIDQLRSAEETAGILNRMSNSKAVSQRIEKLQPFIDQANNTIFNRSEDQLKNSDVLYRFEMQDGQVVVRPNNLTYQKSEYENLIDLERQSKDYQSKLQMDARNQVISEMQAKQQREAQLMQQREQYRQQGIQQQRMIDAAYALFP